MPETVEASVDAGGDLTGSNAVQGSHNEVWNQSRNESPSGANVVSFQTLDSGIQSVYYLLSRVENKIDLFQGRVEDRLRLVDLSILQLQQSGEARKMQSDRIEADLMRIGRECNEMRQDIQQLKREHPTMNLTPGQRMALLTFAVLVLIPVLLLVAQSLGIWKP